MPKQKLKMGMVGGGPGALIGQVHRKAAQLDEDVELISGVFSSDPKKSADMGADLHLDPKRVYCSLDDMLKNESAKSNEERLDFISIVTPNFAHFEPVLKSLEQGFNVMCDKPLAFSLQEALEIAQAVKKSGKVFGLSHNYSGYPMVKQARHLIRSGALGKVIKIHVEYPQGWLLKKADSAQAAWRKDPKKAGISCCVGDIGTHCHHLAAYITGLKLESVCADLSSFGANAAPLDDDASILLRYEGGAKGTLCSSQVEVGGENPLAISVHGTEGRLWWRQEIPMRLFVQPIGKPVEIQTPGNDYLCEAAKRATRLPAGHPEAFYEAFANIYRNFCDSIRAIKEGRKPSELESDFPTAQDGVKGMAFIKAAIENGWDDKTKWTKIEYF